MNVNSRVAAVNSHPVSPDGPSIVYVIVFGNPVAFGNVTDSSVPTTAFSSPLAGSNVGAVFTPVVDSSPVAAVPVQLALDPYGVTVHVYVSPLSSPVNVRLVPVVVSESPAPPVSLYKASFG